jgi:hypothetical protein
MSDNNMDNNRFAQDFGPMEEGFAVDYYAAVDAEEEMEETTAAVF